MAVVNVNIISASVHEQVVFCDGNSCSSDEYDDKVMITLTMGNLENRGGLYTSTCAHTEVIYHGITEINYMNPTVEFLNAVSSPEDESTSSSLDYSIPD